MPTKTTPSTTPTAVGIVRAALEARTADEASHVNDMIALLVGGRNERFIGDTVQNLGALSTPGAPDHKALEPVTNMQDAVIERFARERFDNDPSAAPYETPHEAAAALLGHLRRDEQAEYARVDIYESDAPARQSKRVTITYRDHGCGIGNHYVAQSVFRIGSAHKESNLWQQGAFGMGATTCYPHAKAIVLVTRRPPESLEPGEPDVVTVAIAEWQNHRKGRGIYYLATESVDENPNTTPLAVPAAELPEFEPGTYLALVSYESDGIYKRSDDPASLEFVLNTRLWRSVLPVTLMNHVARGDHPKTHHGRGPQFELTPRDDRKEFHDVMPFAMNGVTRHLPVDVFYFEGGPSGDVGSKRNFVARGHSALFLANGQAHKHWEPQEMKYRASRLTKLYDRILVVVDLDQIPVDQRTSQLFTADRVDFMKTPDAIRLQDLLAAMLNSWSELRDLNNELIRKVMQNRTNGRSTADIAKRIRAQLAFRDGVSLSSGQKDGDEPPPRRKWANADLWPDPTTLEGPATISAVPGKTRFIHFQVNAIDEFFSSGRGKLELACDHPRIGTAELLASRELRGGMVRASLLVPDDVEAGDTATITASIRDWAKAAGGAGADLEWSTKLEIGSSRKPPAGPRRKPTKKEPKATKGSQVAVIWRDSAEQDGWTGAVPGEINFIEASVLASGRDEYAHLGELGSEQIPTVVLNSDYTPLKQYEAQRAKTRTGSTLDDARDRYAVGVGVGMLVLEEHARQMEKKGKARPVDDLVERQAIARAALALMPDFDKLIEEAGLEAESTI